MDSDSVLLDQNLVNLCQLLLGPKRFLILGFLCENIDKFGLIKLRIKDIEQALDVSKPTIIATFKYLEERQLFEKLKNGFYRLHLEKINNKIKLGEKK